MPTQLQERLVPGLGQSEPAVSLASYCPEVSMLESCKSRNLVHSLVPQRQEFLPLFHTGLELERIQVWELQQSSYSHAGRLTWVQMETVGRTAKLTDRNGDKGTNRHVSTAIQPEANRLGPGNKKSLIKHCLK